MIERKIYERFEKLYKNFRVVYLAGARQSGKSTFIKDFAQKHNIKYVNFDNPKIRESASQNPDLFLELNPKPLAIDEVQRVPDIIDYIKISADQSDDRGQYILTGSSNLFHNKHIHESLSGRIAIINMYPFSTSEIKKWDFNLIDILFDKKFYQHLNNIAITNFEQIKQTLCTGRFPEPVLFDLKPYDWFKGYLYTRINKDIEELTEKSLYKISILEKLMPLLAHQISSLLNLTHIATEIKSSYKTVKTYFQYLKALFLVETLLPFYKNIGKQVTKTPKLYFIDTGLVCFLLKLSSDSLEPFSSEFGRLLENHIYLELKKEIEASLENYEIFYYRNDKKQEVDFVIENSKADFIAIEVKAKSNIKSSDLKGLANLISKLGNKLFASYVFYGGKEIAVTKVANSNVFLIPYAYLF